MTDPRHTEQRQKDEALKKTDPEPKVETEVIQDLDAPNDYADKIRGGPCGKNTARA